MVGLPSQGGVIGLVEAHCDGLRHPSILVVLMRNDAGRITTRPTRRSAGQLLREALSASVDHLAQHELDGVDFLRLECGGMTSHQALATDRLELIAHGVRRPTQGRDWRMNRKASVGGGAGHYECQLVGELASEGGADDDGWAQAGLLATDLGIEIRPPQFPRGDLRSHSCTAVSTSASCSASAR